MNICRNSKRFDKRGKFKSIFHKGFLETSCSFRKSKGINKAGFRQRRPSSTLEAEKLRW